jgi:hypothetical protein
MDYFYKLWVSDSVEFNFYPPISHKMYNIKFYYNNLFLKIQLNFI